ncbi:cytochrome P450 71A1-like [Typha angustifolia]|uniref:cytochrome P450 71A1-like n=1 Tax=Typha angustifolia TaxID=59011 RepID=UPI003C2B1184
MCLLTLLQPYVYPFLIYLLCSLFLPFLPQITISRFRKRRSPHPPPSPSRKLPLIGNLHQLGPLPHRTLRAMAEELGPIMLLQLGQIPTLVVSSVDMAREVLKTQDHIFASRPALKVPKKLFYDGKDVAFAPYGEYWRQAKKMSVLHLMSSKMVQSFRRTRQQEVNIMVENISRSCSSSSSSSLKSKSVVVDVTEAFNSLAKHIISRITIGKSSREEKWDDMIHLIIAESSVMMGSFHVGDYFPSLSWLSKLTGFHKRLESIFQRNSVILDEIIESHVNRPPPRDGDDHESENECFLDIMLSFVKGRSMGIPFNNDNIKAILTDMFGAGTDSTYVVMEWAMAELIRNPRVMKKLQDEVRGITGPKALVQEEDVNQMNYLKAVLKETLRLHPPGPLLVPREAINDTSIQGYDIPKQARVFVNVWAIGRDPKIWEDPEEFLPERFIGRFIDFKGHDFELLPFGAGRRLCPGIGLGMASVELALASLVQRFDWELPDGMKGEELDMDELFGLTVRKKTSLNLVATPWKYQADSGPSCYN